MAVTRATQGNVNVYRRRQTSGADGASVYVPDCWRWSGCIWIKPNVSGSDASAYWMVVGDTSSAAKIGWRSGYNTENALLEVTNGGGSDTGTAYALNSGSWFHLGVTVEGSSTGVLTVIGYINGQYWDTVISSRQPSPTNPTLGAQAWGSGARGSLAFMRAWDHAITGAEMAREAVSGCAIKQDGLILDAPLEGTHDLVTKVVTFYKDYAGYGDIQRGHADILTDPAGGPPIAYGVAPPPIHLFGADVGPSASISPSASVSPSASTSPSASESPSPSPSIAPLDGIAWGEQNPDPGETPVTWKRWQVSPGVQITVQGDADWGKAEVEDGTIDYGDVVDTGDTSTKTFTVTRDKYGAGSGNISVYIRGQASPFTQHAGSPSWNLYSGATTQAWRYVQLRMDYAS
jgi:hypothetical protein